MWEHGFRGGLVVRIPGFHHHGLSSTSSKGTEIHGQKRKKKKNSMYLYRKIWFQSEPNTTVYFRTGDTKKVEAVANNATFAMPLTVLAFSSTSITVINMKTRGLPRLNWASISSQGLFFEVMFVLFLVDVVQIDQFFHYILNLKNLK